MADHGRHIREEQIKRALGGMKNILLFAGETYEQNGGINDLFYATDNKQDAIQYADRLIESKRGTWSEPWAQVFSLTDGGLIALYQSGRWLEHENLLEKALESVCAAIDGLPPYNQAVCIERAAQAFGMRVDVSHIQELEYAPDKNVAAKNNIQIKSSLIGVLREHIQLMLNSIPEDDRELVKSVVVDKTFFAAQKEAGITTVLGLRIEYV